MRQSRVVAEAGRKAVNSEHSADLMQTAWQQLRLPERVFVDEFIRTDNASNAVVAAYPELANSNSVAGVRAMDMLNRPLVQAAIAEKARAIVERYDVSLEALMLELAYIAKSSIADYHKLTDDGEPYLDLTDVTPEMMKAVKSIKVEDVVEGRGNDKRTIRKVSFELHDKLTAIDKLIRIHGAYAPVGMQVSGPGGGPIQTETTVTALMSPEQAAEHYAKSLED